MTNKDFLTLVQAIQLVIGKQETKTQKKLYKVYEKVVPVVSDYEKQLEELRLDNSSIDEKGILLLDEKGQYKFNKDGMRNLTKQVNQLNEKEVEFKKITIVNPKGLEDFVFLKDFVEGVIFTDDATEEEEL